MVMVPLLTQVNRASALLFVKNLDSVFLKIEMQRQCYFTDLLGRKRSDEDSRFRAVSSSSLPVQRASLQHQSCKQAWMVVVGRVCSRAVLITQNRESLLMITFHYFKGNHKYSNQIFLGINYLGVIDYLWVLNTCKI